MTCEDCAGSSGDRGKIDRELLRRDAAVLQGGEDSLLQTNPALAAATHSLARVPSTLLITGETGSGKGVVARAIHQLSNRRRAPFVHVDCSALAPSLLESELFGHERGSFTGADGRRKGRFELAGSGTIFLDEVGDMDLSSQKRLLRVLEERTFERVGGICSIKMRARIVAGTNRDLRAAIADGSFRVDLFYRLCVTRLHVAPLRERIDELPMLVEIGLRRVATRLERSVPASSTDFCNRLSKHDWPGNIRELFNVLEHVVVCAPPERLCLHGTDLQGVIGSNGYFPSRSDLFPGDDRHGGSLDSSLVATLTATAGNVSRAARRLGVPRSTLRYRIQRAELGHLLVKD